MTAPWTPADADARSALLDALRAAAGPDAVATSEADTFAYTRDLWPRLTFGVRDGLPQTPPLAVVRPADEAAVARVVQTLHDHGAPVVAYGAGSGVCGGAAPLFGGVVVDLKRLDAQGPVDPASMQITVGPGLMLQTLEERLNDDGWTLGHFPSSIWCCSVGGCVAARGAGQLSSRYGKIEDMVTGLRVVTPGLGTVSTGSLDPARTATDWSPLFIGSEGTLGLITEIRLRVHPLPEAMVLRGIEFPSVEAGIEAFREILQMGLRPSVMRLYDPLDTWMAMQKSNDPADAIRPRPGAGRPPLEGAQPERPPENADAPRPTPPQDAGTPRVFGKVLSPGSLTDSALNTLSKVPGLGRLGWERRKASERRDGTGRGGGRRSTDGPTGFRGMLVRTLASRLLGDDYKDKLKPENLPMDKLLGHAGTLNRAIDLLPGRSLAILGCEGGDERARAELEAAVLAAGRLGGKDLGAGPGERWFRTRYHVSFKLPKLLASGAWADTMETAAPWTAVPGLYAAVRKALAPHVLVMAHFSHAYHEGCSIYFTLAGHAPTTEERIALYERAWQAILSASHGAGATITHHHGVGFLKKDFMGHEHGDSRVLYDVAKHALDPKAVLNPGKLFPDAPDPPGPSLPPPDPQLLAVGDHADGVAEASVEWRGVDLAAELHLRGHWLPPLGRTFLEQPVADWLSDGAWAAHVGVHGAWEHPLQQVGGRLPDGRSWRSGHLPRSAAGPSWLPFGIGGPAGTRAERIILRTLTPPPLRHLGFVFAHREQATTALRQALRGAQRPLAGLVYSGQDPAAYRSVFQSDDRPRDGGVVYLAFAWPDGYPDGTAEVAQRLTDAGGTPLSDDQGLAWWEDHWGQPQREGADALALTGPLPDDKQIGQLRAVVGWAKAGLLLRAIETLTGGPTTARGVIEAPQETGCTLHVRFRSSRPDQPVSPLVEHQVRATIRSFGGWVEHLSFTAVDALPPGTVDDTSTGDAARITAAMQAGLDTLVGGAG